jgi:hypothetical protein
MRRDRTLTLLAVAASCALVLPACGSDDSSGDDQPASATTGTTGATSSTAPAKGASGASGKAGKSRKKSAGSSSGETGGAKGGGSKESKPSSDSSGGATGASGSGGSSGPVIRLPGKVTKAQRKELYREAKIICTSLTLDGLAREYEVKATPDAVARAYSKAYAANLRGAAYDGCKAGVTP